MSNGVRRRFGWCGIPGLPKTFKKNKAMTMTIYAFSPELSGLCILIVMPHGLVVPVFSVHERVCWSWQVRVIDIGIVVAFSHHLGHRVGR